MNKEYPQIDFAECYFKWHGKKICYLSRGRLCKIAKDRGVAADGIKLQIYNRLVAQLENSNAGPEIGSVKI